MKIDKGRGREFAEELAQRDRAEQVQCNTTDYEEAVTMFDIQKSGITRGQIT